MEDKFLEWMKSGEEESCIDFGKVLADSSDIICAVSKMHEAETKKLYPDKKYSGKITSVTNAVFLGWMSVHMQQLYDKYAAGWRNETELLKDAKIPDKELLVARYLNKIDLCEAFHKWRADGEVISNFTDLDMDGREPLTYAKRLTDYKRPDAVLRSAKNFPNETFIFSDKPADEGGERFLRELIRTITTSDTPRIAYIANYDRAKAAALVKASKWINIPEAAREASGTSGMKVLVNGGIQTATFSGWAAEALKDGENAFVVDDSLSNFDDKLEEAVHISSNGKGIEMIRNAISSAPYVLAQRMLDEYVSKLYN
ncbi:MAG: hypothetical protein V1836_00615 [Candidatus Aenigmatarchaeota archaeon]